jgi:hypothetical protein
MSARHKAVTEAKHGSAHQILNPALNYMEPDHPTPAWSDPPTLPLRLLPQSVRTRCLTLLPRAALQPHAPSTNLADKGVTTPRWPRRRRGAIKRENMALGHTSHTLSLSVDRESRKQASNLPLSRLLKSDRCCVCLWWIYGPIV